MSDRERVPPHSEEAEREVLGTCMLERGAVQLVAPVLEPDDFYRAEHQAVYSAMLMVLGSGELEWGSPVDMHLVCEQLRKMDKADVAANVDLLTGLTDGLTSLANVRYRARIVKEKSDLRKLISACYGGLSLAYDEEAGAIGSTASAIRDIELRSGIVEIPDNRVVLLDMIERAEQGEPDAEALPTGVGKLDVATHGGFRRGELVLIGGRPGTGKSVATANMMRNGLQRGYRMALFSLEVSQPQFLSNLVACTARVDGARWRGGPRENLGAWQRVEKLKSELDGTFGTALSNCLIDDGADLTPTLLQAKCESFAMAGAVDVVFVDHVQLMGSDRTGKDVREIDKLTDASRALKLLAKRLHCVVVALSQLSRSSEKERRAPRLDDLRASGSLEQDADIVVLLHDSPKDKQPTNDRHDWIVAKQRNGPRRTLRMRFVREQLRFEPYIDGDAEPEPAPPADEEDPNDIF